MKYFAISDGISIAMKYWKYFLLAFAIFCATWEIHNNTKKISKINNVLS